MTPSNSNTNVIRIQLIRGKRVIRTYTIASESITIGSDPSCTIKMAGDRTLLPKHATLYQEEGEISVVPESGAVVLLNDEPVDFGIIEPGDVVKIGKMVFTAELVHADGDVVPESGRQSKAPPAIRKKTMSAPPPHAPIRNTSPVKSFEKETLPSDTRSARPGRRPSIPDKTIEYSQRTGSATKASSNVQQRAAGARPPSPMATQRPAAPLPTMPPVAPESSKTAEAPLMVNAVRPPKASIPVVTNAWETGQESMATPKSPPKGTEAVGLPSFVMSDDAVHDNVASQIDSFNLDDTQDEIATQIVQYSSEEYNDVLEDAHPSVPPDYFQEPTTEIISDAVDVSPNFDTDNLNADDYFFDDGDDPEEDEFFFSEPFDLGAALTTKAPLESRDVANVKLENFCAADVVRTTGNRVVETDYVRPGQKYQAAFDKMKMRSLGATVELVVEPRMLVAAQKADVEVDVARLSKSGNLVKLLLTAGDYAELTGKGGQYRVEVYQPPIPPTKSAVGFNSGGLAMLLGAIILHAAVTVFAWAVFPKDIKEIEADEEKEFAEVEIEKPEFKKEEEKKPEPRAVKQDATAMAERAPKVSNRAVRRIRERATNAKPSNSVSSLLNVLSRGSGKAGKTNNIKDLVSNIDAVGSSKGSASYNIAGAIASLPGGDVNVAREGGGGAVSTLSGEQVAGKGSKIAALTRTQPSGKIRGKVTKMSSGARVKGSLSKEDVSRVVNSHINAVQACYEKALLRSPGLSGRIVFDWTVRTDGRVSGVRVRSSTLGNAAVSSCISGNIKKWKFPRPKGGEVVITYPFLFRSVSS